MHVLPASDTAPDEALRILSSGGIVAHATETCYGLACDLSNPAAVATLFAVKQRPPTQPVSALFASLEQAKQFVEWNDEAQKLADEYLPGPLTLILPLRSDAPLRLHPTPPKTQRTQTTQKIQMKKNPHRPFESSESFESFESFVTLGLRLSSHPLAQQLATRFGSPLSTTSANISGHPSPYSAEEIARQFEGQEHQPNLIIDSGKLPPTPPSTIINLVDGSTLRTGKIHLQSPPVSGI